MLKWNVNAIRKEEEHSQYSSYQFITFEFSNPLYMILFISTIIYPLEDVFIQIILMKNHGNCGGLNIFNRKAKIIVITPEQIMGRLSYYSAPIVRHPVVVGGVTQFRNKENYFSSDSISFWI
jgi:hypothetical protein